MRIRDIVTESWWEGLDQSHLKMMGYSKEPSITDEVDSDLATQVSKDVKSLKKRPRPLPSEPA